MTIHQVHTCLKGFRKDPDMWNANMDGFLNFGEQELNDHQVRLVVEYGISKGYRLECDIPGEEVDKLLKEHENDRILYLSIKREWFLKILDGTKNEEYREIKPYWVKRFIEGRFDTIIPWLLQFARGEKGSDLPWKKYTHVCFINGRDANKCLRVEKEITSISIDYPKPGLCPKEFLGKEYFVIKFK